MLTGTGNETEPKRLASLDAYRGLIMIFLVSHGFGFDALKGHPVWGVIADQVDHVAWEGMVLWDLIQPAFMFMVGVAMPYSLANCAHGFSENLIRVLLRAAKLVFLSQLFVIVQEGNFQFGLINVLSQIALTYVICFLLMQLSVRWQVAAAVALLSTHWALFVLFPGPEGPFSKSGNVGQMLDWWLLGRNYSGYYVTINFLSSTVTTMLGVWAGELLRRDLAAEQKLKLLCIWGSGLIAAGLLLTAWNPMVKRIWTTSFTLTSGGLVVLGLAIMLWWVDMRNHRQLAFPLVVVGMNSIFVYVISQLCRGSIHRAVGVFGWGFQWAGTLAPVVHAWATLCVIWYACFWLYQRKVFFKI